MPSNNERIICEQSEFAIAIERELAQPDPRIRKTLKVNNRGRLYFFNLAGTRFELDSRLSRDFCAANEGEFDYHYDSH